MDFSANSVMNRIFTKISLMQNSLASFPHTTKNGNWLTHDNAHWTGGFWVGILWIKSLFSPNYSADREIAQNWAMKLRVREKDNKTHDQGFIFGPSCVFGYRITKNAELAELAKFGADNMKSLYRENPGLILAWDEPDYEGVAIIDTVMNLPLMIWVSDITANTEYKDIAINVADKIIENFIRDDFSTYHTVRWDVDSSRIVERSTHQGFSADSCWSRGQAWALYGFANMYRYTGENRFLSKAIKLAEYFWSHIDDNFLPKWDFIFKNDDVEPIDSSAASIAASGMLLISDILSKNCDIENMTIWNSRAKQIIYSLLENCLCVDNSNYGLINMATVDKPRNSGLAESTMYGDYYFIESIMRLSDTEKRYIDAFY
jgi:unsaturated chondroitin disaccharide hydrolase